MNNSGTQEYILKTKANKFGGFDTWAVEADLPNEYFFCEWAETKEESIRLSRDYIIARENGASWA